jgi:TRAP-type uncharacterized transport system fused permease subunit
MFFWLRRTNILEWLILAPATILLYWPTLFTDAVGIGMVAIVLFSQVSRNKKDQAKLAAA